MSPTNDQYSISEDFPGLVQSVSQTLLFSRKPMVVSVLDPRCGTLQLIFAARCQGLGWSADPSVHRKSLPLSSNPGRGWVWHDKGVSRHI